MRRRPPRVAALAALAALAAAADDARAAMVVTRERVCDRPSPALLRDGLLGLAYAREEEPDGGSTGAVTVENDGSHPVHITAPTVALVRTLVLPGERRRLPLAVAPAACIDAIVEFWSQRAPDPADAAAASPGRGMWRGGSSRPSSSSR